jgi:hypothetical protein
MATHFQRLYDVLSHDLDFHLVVFVNRRYWEKNNTISLRDIETLYEIVQETFDETEPDIQYMVMLALRCTLIRPFPDTYENAYACEDVYELAVRNVQHILMDYRDRLIRSLHMAHHSALVIQKQWRKCITNPEYKACKNRLFREFENLQK